MVAFIVTAATPIRKTTFSPVCCIANDGISKTTGPRLTTVRPSPSPSFATLFYRAASLAESGIAATTFCFAHEANAYGLIGDHLEKCRGDIPCVSTTSEGSPSKLGAPWSYQPQTDDVDIAWAALKRAVVENKDKGSIVESIDGPNEYYLRAEFPSSIRGIDDLEFRLMKKDALVTYRSSSREAIYVYPLQTPINFDKNKNRLLDIRQSLGWEEFSGFNVIDTTLEGKKTVIELL